MGRPHLLIQSTSQMTRLHLRVEGETLLRARLPLPHPSWWRVAPMLADALALWLGQPLCVVLNADELDNSSGLGLCDAFGFGARTLHYEVEVVPARRRRLRDHRAPAVCVADEVHLAAPSDPRQLDLGGVK